MNWSALVNFSLVFGTLFSAALMVLIVISLMVNKEIYLNDYPPDVKKVWGPISEKAKRQRAVFAAILFAAIIAGMALATIRLGDILGGTPSFLAVFASAAIIFSTFNLVDAVILDWLILVVLWPGLGVLPGTEGMAGYRDVRWWTVNLFKGVVIAPVMALISAGITMLVIWIGSLL